MPVDIEFTRIVDEVTSLVGEGRSANAAARLPAALVDPAERWPAAQAVVNLIGKVAALPVEDEHRATLLDMIEREVEWPADWQEAGIDKSLSSARASQSDQAGPVFAVIGASIVALPGILAWYGVVNLSHWYLRVPLALLGTFILKVAGRILSDGFKPQRRRRKRGHAVTPAAGQGSVGR